MFMISCLLLYPVPDFPYTSSNPILYQRNNLK